MNIVFNGNMIGGQIHELVDLAVSNDKSFIDYMDGDTSRIALITI